MKITVVMASYLKPYPGSAKNADKKFLRAISSFKKQTYEDKELIIISDGCEITNKLYEENFINDENIHLLPISKQPLYGAETRDMGLRQANGDIICYLDADDMIGKTHLETIANQFYDDVDFVYYNDYLVQSVDFKKLYVREVEPRWGSIGTSSIAHRNFYDKKYEHINVKPRWSSGYSHDWLFILDMIAKGMQFKKLKNAPQYLVCHWGGQGDF